MRGSVRINVHQCGAIERVTTGSAHRIGHYALRYGADKFGVHIVDLFLDMMYWYLIMVWVRSSFTVGSKVFRYILLRSQCDKP